MPRPPGSALAVPAEGAPSLFLLTELAALRKQLDVLSLGQARIEADLSGARTALDGLVAGQRESMAALRAQESVPRALARAEDGPLAGGYFLARDDEECEEGGPGSPWEGAEEAERPEDCWADATFLSPQDCRAHAKEEQAFLSRQEAERPEDCRALVKEDRTFFSPQEGANWPVFSSQDAFCSCCLTPHMPGPNSSCLPTPSPGLRKMKSSCMTLRRTFQVTQAERALHRILKLSMLEEQSRQSRTLRPSYTWLGSFGKKLDEVTVDLAFDSAMGVTICLNAIFIGLSLDLADGGGVGWVIVDIVFAAIFWFEMIFKVIRLGLREQRCKMEPEPGQSWVPFRCKALFRVLRGGFHEQYCKRDFHSVSNLFDASLVIIDTIQLIFTAFVQASTSQGISASLFRIVRLVRLVRVLRLLRSHVFKDLLAMIQGLLGGMATLGWAIVLFGVTIYVVALLFREGLGNDDGSQAVAFQHFNSVPRSMFTVFRCSFGDCTTYDGLPIFENIARGSGLLVTLAYCFFIFVVTIGLFNVISAIFVESTLASAAELALKKKRQKLENEQRWALNMNDLVKSLVDYSPSYSMPERPLESVDKILHMEFPRELIDEVVQTKEVQRALDNLDIDPADHVHLSDILDPDISGTISVQELVMGLKRLRGEPRRSDLVTVNLMIRSLVDKIDLLVASFRSSPGPPQIAPAPRGGTAALDERPEVAPAA